MFVGKTSFLRCSDAHFDASGIVTNDIKLF